MNLLPELDEEKTKDNVVNFFNKDLEKLVLMSGRKLTDLQSPNFDNQSSGSSFVNSNELKLIDGLDTQNIVKSVYDALYHGVDDTSRRILIGQYIEHKRWIDLGFDINREKSSFAKYRKRALIMFAYSFEAWQYRNHCDDIVKLREFKNTE